MLLELDDIHVHYGKVQALRGVSVQVAEGEIVTLVGLRERPNEYIDNGSSEG